MINWKIYKSLDSQMKQCHLKLLKSLMKNQLKKLSQKDGIKIVLWK